VFEAMHTVAEQPRHAPSEAVTSKQRPSGS
jgi:hypothetical protein